MTEGIKKEPPDSVTTHVLFCKGSWKIGSQSKEDKLRNMFVEIASTSPNNDSAPITPHALLLALRDHSSSLNEYFGKKSHCHSSGKKSHCHSS